MAYFDIEQIKNIKKETIFPILRIAAILTLAGAVLVIVLLRADRDAEDVERKEDPVLTKKEKIRILESLSSPSDAPQHTNEKKRQILEILSAPSDQPTLSAEEKRAILKSLSAPKE